MSTAVYITPFISKISFPFIYFFKHFKSLIILLKLAAPALRTLLEFYIILHLDRLVSLIAKSSIDLYLQIAFLLYFN